MRNTVTRLAVIIALVRVGAAKHAYTDASAAASGDTPNKGNGPLVLHIAPVDPLTLGATQPLTFTADNPGSSSVRVRTISATVTVDELHAGSCDASNFTVRPRSTDIVVPAHAKDVALGVATVTFLEAGANQDGCKGATLQFSARSN